jgi:arylsulfatase
MVQKWTDMTHNVLHASGRHSLPAIQAKIPHTNPQWTNFDRPAPAQGARARRRTNTGLGNRIRARKNTELTISDGTLQLRFTGEDPGIALDLRSLKLPAGPYRLKFRLLGGVKDGGDVFYTVDPKVTLPRGKRIEFPIRGDGKWQEVEIELPTNKQLQQLRIDFSSGAGKATVADLKLQDADGMVIASWPQQK